MIDHIQFLFNTLFYFIFIFIYVQTFSIKSGGLRERTDYALKPELEREIQPETPVAQRCKALKELGDVVRNDRLEDVINLFNIFKNSI